MRRTTIHHGNSTPRVMVDTTVLIAGVIWPRFPYEVLRHALRGDFALILSPIVVAEARRTFRKRFPTLSDSFENFLESVPREEALDPTVEEVHANRNLLRDITDVPVALAALAAQVDYFVTEDKDYTDANQPIHARLRVLLPGTFLNEVMGRSHEELESIRRRTWTEIPDPETDA